MYLRKELELIYVVTFHHPVVIIGTAKIPNIDIKYRKCLEKPAEMDTISFVNFMNWKDE